MRGSTFVVLSMLMLWWKPGVSAQEPLGASLLRTEDAGFSAVEALLTLRCIECHGPEKQKGGLRLDTESDARRGGDSGNPAVLENLESSELYARLISEDPGLRMPKGRGALPPKQIEAVRRWLVAGANWPEGLVIGPPEVVKGLPDWALALSSAGERYALLGRALLVAMFLLLIGERWRARGRPGLERIRYFYPAIIFAALAAGFYLLFLSEIRKRESIQLHVRELQGLGRGDDLSKLPGEPPRSYRPTAPPRLSGTWYRGNDERGNDGLFNGGFYCTTVFDLALQDQEGKQVEWGKATEGELLLTFDLRRAPSATPKLYEQQRMESVTLTDALPAVPLTDSNQLFRIKTIEAGEHWRFEVPVPAATGAEDEVSSVLYLYNSKGEVGSTLSSPHYAVGYDLRWKNGVLTADSEVWMGVIYLTGNIFIAPEGKIMLNEWFDARPMPFIEGQNTDDPEALGLPEHLGADE